MFDRGRVQSVQERFAGQIAFTLPIDERRDPVEGVGAGHPACPGPEPMGQYCGFEEVFDVRR